MKDESMGVRFAKRAKSAFRLDQQCVLVHHVYESEYVRFPRFAASGLRIVECQRHRLSCWPSRVESQYDLFMAFGVLLSPQLQQQRCHLREHHLRTLHLRMACWTQRDHQFQPGDAGDAMHGDLAFSSTGSTPDSGSRRARGPPPKYASSCRFIV